MRKPRDGPNGRDDLSNVKCRLFSSVIELVKLHSTYLHYTLIITTATMGTWHPSKSPGFLNLRRIRERPSSNGIASESSSSLMYAKEDYTCLHHCLQDLDITAHQQTAMLYAYQAW
jgi:hypothetical protein